MFALLSSVIHVREAAGPTDERTDHLCPRLDSEPVVDQAAEEPEHEHGAGKLECERQAARGVGHLRLPTRPLVHSSPSVEACGARRPAVARCSPSRPDTASHFHVAPGSRPARGNRLSRESRVGKHRILTRRELVNLFTNYPTRGLAATSRSQTLPQRFARLGRCARLDRANLAEARLCPTLLVHWRHVRGHGAPGGGGNHGRTVRRGPPPPAARRGDDSTLHSARRRRRIADTETPRYVRRCSRPTDSRAQHHGRHPLGWTFGGSRFCNRGRTAGSVAPPTANRRRHDAVSSKPTRDPPPSVPRSSSGRSRWRRPCPGHCAGSHDHRPRERADRGSAGDRARGGTAPPPFHGSRTAWASDRPRDEWTKRRGTA